MPISNSSRPVAEGCLISVSRREARSGGRGGSVGDAAQLLPPGGSSRAVPACRPHVAGAVMASSASSHRTAGDRQDLQRWRGLGSAKAGGPERTVHRGRCGADRLNTARGTPWVWRTCGLSRRSSTERRRTNGLQHASMLRGVEVRGSFGIQERPARPRHLSRAADLDCGLRRTRRRSKNTGDESCLVET